MHDADVPSCSDQQDLTPEQKNMSGAHELLLQKQQPWQETLIAQLRRIFREYFQRSNEALPRAAERISEGYSCKPKILFAGFSSLAAAVQFFLSC